MPTLRSLLFALLVLAAFCAEAQIFSPTTHPTAPQERRMRVLWWNVENLFDTLHDAGFDDREFLPESERRWTSSRYWHKQGALARVIVAAGGMQPVDVVGMCEVENDSVIAHLTHRTRLARLGYKAVVTHSTDRRGIDLALLYQPETFALLSWSQHPVPHDSLRERPTRPLLLVSGRLPTGDTLDVMLAHFPSRRGGAHLTEPYRLRAAGVAVVLMDSLALRRTRPLFLLMGDLNDEPSNRSVSEVLASRLVPISAEARPLPAAGNDDIRGTYFFRRRWSRIDNLLVSSTLLSPTAPLHTRPDACRILALPELLEEVNIGEHRPRHTYLGPRYHGGISDHLPLLIDLWY